MTNDRAEVLNQIVDLILEIERPHPLRVAIDGVDAAGKTTIADELAPLIEHRRRQVIRASIDGFHRPRVERYRRGANSPEGYYYDSFDYIALIDNLLIPLSPGGNRVFRRALYDYRADKSLNPKTELALQNAVLLLDGVFLLRQELNRYWDFRIFVDVAFEVAVGRAISRDSGVLGSNDDVLRRYWEKYVLGQLIYIESVQPMKKANLILNNDEFSRPIISQV
jgi:uridine kinase